VIECFYGNYRFHETVLGRYKNTDTRKNNRERDQLLQGCGTEPIVKENLGRKGVTRAATSEKVRAGSIRKSDAYEARRLRCHHIADRSASRTSH